MCVSRLSHLTDRGPCLKPPCNPVPDEETAAVLLTPISAMKDKFQMVDAQNMRNKTSGLFGGACAENGGGTVCNHTGGDDNFIFKQKTSHFLWAEMNLLDRTNRTKNEPKKINSSKLPACH